MTSRTFALRFGRLLVAQAAHLLALLLPTLALAGPRQIGWPIRCFAFGVAAAAVLEDLSVRQQFSVKSAAIRDKLAVRVAHFVGVCLLAIFWSAQLERLGHGQAALVVHLFGASLLVVGIFLRVAAIRALGTQFVSDIRVDGQIVRDGVYAWLRHPSEIGLLLIAIGAPLLIGSPRTSIVAGMLLLPISLWRMRRENRVLSMSHGAPMATCQLDISQKD